MVSSAEHQIRVGKDLQFVLTLAKIGHALLHGDVHKHSHQGVGVLGVRDGRDPVLVGAVALLLRESVEVIEAGLGKVFVTSVEQAHSSFPLVDVLSHGGVYAAVGVDVVGPEVAAGSVHHVNVAGAPVQIAERLCEKVLGSNKMFA